MINAYTSITKKVSNNLTIYPKELEKEQSPELEGRIQHRTKINEILTKKSIEKINEMKSWFFEKKKEN